MSTPAPYTPNATIAILPAGADGVASVTWNGGDILGVMPSLLQGADPRFITYPIFPDAVGRRFTIGPYLLETIAVQAAPLPLIIARRVWSIL